MGTRRIVYALTLAGCVFFFVLYPYWFSWYLLVLILLLIPFDLLVSLPGMLTRHISLSAPYMLEQDASGTVVITTLHERRLPARCIKALLHIYGEGRAARRRIICSAAHGSRYDYPVNTSHSGVTVFETKRIWVVSLFGLFSMPVPSRNRTSVLVLPAPAKPPNIAALPRGIILRPKPGGGFSEEHDMRQYRQGDHIRNIHWKISAKLDTLIVREPLAPPPHSRLVHVVQWNGRRERDLVLSRLRWISDYLLKWDISFYVRIGDDGPVAEVASSEDLFSYLHSVLGGTPDAVTMPASVPIRFTWVFRVDAL